MELLSDIITQTLQDGVRFDTVLDDFFEKTDLQAIIEANGGGKRSGATGAEILEYIIRLRLGGLTLCGNAERDYADAPCGKTAVYDYLRREGTDWNGILVDTVEAVEKELEAVLGPDQSERLLIVDDTDRHRSYSKKTELASWQNDHSGLGKRNYVGYKQLMVGTVLWNQYFPLTLALFASDKVVAGDGNVKDCPEGSPGRQRRDLARMPRTEEFVELSRHCFRRGYGGDRFLADSFFTDPKSVLRARRLGCEVIGALKEEGNARYQYRDTGEWLTVREIFEREQTLHGDDASTGDRVFYDVPVLCRFEVATWPARILYFDNVNDGRDYFSLLTTDMAVSSIKAKELYGKRFKCEFCHKDEKDGTTIRTEGSCQALDFDEVFAMAAVDLIIYIILARRLLLDRAAGDKGASVGSEFTDAKVQEGLASGLNMTLALLRALVEAFCAEYGLDPDGAFRLAGGLLASNGEFAGRVARCARLSKEFCPSVLAPLAGAPPSKG